VSHSSVAGGGPPGSSAVDDLVTRNGIATLASVPGPRPAAPALRVAVVTCMDARIDVFRALGLAPGDAHVIRNAGGIVTDDVLRSLAISQHALGTREVLVAQHTECGLIGLDDESVAARIEAACGARPPMALGGFPNLHDEVRRSVARVRAAVFLPHRDAVRGFVYDVEWGRLREVY
jgi:carbonic anhydrase